MLARPEVSNLVMQNLNGIGNFVNMQQDAHAAYDDLKWGIEAYDDNGTVRI
jgi:hypothetical protein